MKLDLRTDRFSGYGITLEQLRAFVYVTRCLVLTFDGLGFISKIAF
ncbi:hypothetical protein XBJ2_460004 [Xenorhabdus bovienii str. Jollieti]|nr:hypothetical protein XBJ2_460004 [Xenorhabdus bovienii str. Jollieti]